MENTVKVNRYSEIREKLLAAFSDLRRQGIIARADYMCCGSCATYNLLLEAERRSDKGKVVKGIAYWHKQDEESFRKSGMLFIGYSGVKKFRCKLIAEMIVETLNEYGLVTEWDGSDSNKVEVKGIHETK